MSQTSQYNSGNQANIQADTYKMFVWNNRFDSGLFDEPLSSGAYTLVKGQLLGRIASTGKLKICAAASTDGSQIPIGICLQNVDMAEDATSVAVTYCISGDVEQSKIVFSGAETLNTVVTIATVTPVASTYTRRFRDLIQNLGIKLVAGTELTAYDNDMA